MPAAAADSAVCMPPIAAKCVPPLLPAGSSGWSVVGRRRELLLSTHASTLPRPLLLLRGLRLLLRGDVAAAAAPLLPAASPRRQCDAAGEAALLPSPLLPPSSKSSKRGSASRGATVVATVAAMLHRLRCEWWLTCVPQDWCESTWLSTDPASEAALWGAAHWLPPPPAPDELGAEGLAGAVL